MFHIYETDSESRDEAKTTRVVATVYREDEVRLFLYALQARSSLMLDFVKDLQ